MGSDIHSIMTIAGEAYRDKTLESRIERLKKIEKKYKMGDNYMKVIDSYNDHLHEYNKKRLTVSGWFEEGLQSQKKATHRKTKSYLVPNT